MCLQWGEWWGACAISGRNPPGIFGSTFKDRIAHGGCGVLAELSGGLTSLSRARSLGLSVVLPLCVASHLSTVCPTWLSTASTVESWNSSKMRERNKCRWNYKAYDSGWSCRPKWENHGWELPSTPSRYLELEAKENADIEVNFLLLIFQDGRHLRRVLYEYH